LDQENALPDEFPILTFRDLSKDKLTTFRKRDEADEESDLGSPIISASSDLDLTSIDNDDDSIIVIRLGEVSIVSAKDKNDPLLDIDR
jgi:hypothetical protein